VRKAIYNAVGPRTKPSSEANIRIEPFPFGMSSRCACAS
jgi:hypothetical protein